MTMTSTNVRIRKTLAPPARTDVATIPAPRLVLHDGMDPLSVYTAPRLPAFLDVRISRDGASVGLFPKAVR